LPGADESEMVFLILVACTEYDLSVSADDDGRDGPDAPFDSGWAPEFEDCEDGYWADYFNLPREHPEMEIDITGLMPGDVPQAHDWWDEQYFVRRELNDRLDFGSDWWPVNEGLAGDPQYFAVHWFAWLEMAEAGDVSFDLGSDDDSWAYIDGALVADLGGIHSVETTSFTVWLQEGVHTLDLYMAERHTTGSGFWFQWSTENLAFYACPGR